MLSGTNGIEDDEDDRIQGASSEDILRAIRKQEERFHYLALELDHERRGVAHQLKQFKHREQNSRGDCLNPAGSTVLSNMADSHLVQYCPDQPFIHSYMGYPPEGEPASYDHTGGLGSPHIQESYSMSYHTTTSNGHLQDHAPTPPALDNATLVSRNTSQTKTQQVKTITKVIHTRDIRHIGMDGRPLDHVPPPQYSTNEYVNYTFKPPHYGTAYDSSGQPPSATSPYQPEYGTYGGRVSPVYSPSSGHYAGYPTRPPSSVPSESPLPPHRAMPQAPPSHQPPSYDEVDHYRSTPSPAPDRYAPYGYSPGYIPGYEAPASQGYLDDQTGYDDQRSHAGSQRGLTSQDMVTRSGNLEYGGIVEDRDGARWRYPDLHEVIEFLSHPNNIVRANAAAYLQHLCYMDDNMKQKTRALGGIPALVELLNQDIPEIQKNACGALRNLSYGRQNDENKRAIKNAGGIPALIRLLRKSSDNEIRELITGILWNLSSCEDLKRPILDEALSILVNQIIIPHSGWDRTLDFASQNRHQEIPWSTVFKNASGVLRNVSSAGEYARRKMRECEGLVDSILHLVYCAAGKNDMDNKGVENCVCILRNLSYRCQEVEDPDYDKTPLSPSTPSRAVAPLKAMGDNLGCFGVSKKKRDNGLFYSTGGKRDVVTTCPTSRSTLTKATRGMALLWQPEIVQLYLSILSDCSNHDTLEGAAGAIQNLAACYWPPSVEIRAAIRKEKGLLILLDLLRMDVDRVVCAVATAARNLAMDHCNKELIGKYAMRDLVHKLPNGNPQNEERTSDDTIAAVLATLNEVILQNSEFSRSLLEAGGIERLMYISRQKSKFSSRVLRFTQQLLYNMWQHQELREVYKKAGWKESQFICNGTLTSSGRTPSKSPLISGSGTNTISRPISSQGGTKYEDRTLPRGTAAHHNNFTGQHMQYNRTEDLAMNDLNHVGDPPLGGVPVYPGTMVNREPDYAQVNREMKKRNTNRGGGSCSISSNSNGGESTMGDHRAIGTPDASSQSALLDNQGDSWV